MFEQSRHRTLFNPIKEKENINKAFEKNMIVGTIFEFGIRLRKGKALASLTSIVLNKNVLIIFTIEC